MRKIRANAIAILTVAWILGTFYYLWQDNRAHAASSSGRGAQRAGGRPEQLREDRTIPLIVSTLCAPGERRAGDPRRTSCPPLLAEVRRARPEAACPEHGSGFVYVGEFLLVVMATCAGPGGARVLGCREGDSMWGQGESAASLVGPACARDWERGGSRGPAQPGLGTRGLRASHHPQKASGPGVQ